jgi:8-oxo-dGTP diphosphatase
MSESQNKNPNSVSMLHLEVVGAVFFRRGPEILVFRRQSHDRGGGQWEFPGGKVDPGETLEEALIREIYEELGVAGKCLKALGSRVHEYPKRSIRLSLFLFEPEAWNFCLTDHQALAWVDLEQSKTLEWAPADIPWVSPVFAEVEIELKRRSGEQ